MEWMEFMADLTAIILTRNEEKFIENCISSIKSIVKRIIVVDSFSDDNTIDLAKRHGAEVWQHEFINYSAQFTYAVDIATVSTKWILRIDADECLTPESAEELNDLCNKNEDTNVTGIILRFYNIFLGKPMKHGGMYPWKKLSVYKTGVGRIENRNMDEHIILDHGDIVTAKVDSIHHAFRGLNFFIKKCNWYSTREAMDYFEGEKIDKANSNFKTRIKMKVYYRLPLGLRSWLYYIYRYYIRLGFLDGKEGKIFAFLHAYWYRFLVDAKIFEHKKMGEDFEPTGALE